MNKYHDKQIIKYSIASHVLGEFLLGKKLTKSDINKLIPEDVSLSPEDILKCLRNANILILHDRNATLNGDTVWHMTYDARKSFLESPATHKHYKLAMDKQKSIRADFNKIQALKEKYGPSVIVSALFTHHNQ